MKAYPKGAVSGAAAGVGKLKIVKPLESVPMTDGEKLAWERFIVPAQQAIQAVQIALGAAQELLVTGMMEAHSMRPEDGWVLNAERRAFERYPERKG